MYEIKFYGINYKEPDNENVCVSIYIYIYIYIYKIQRIFSQ